MLGIIGAIPSLVALIPGIGPIASVVASAGTVLRRCTACLIALGVAAAWIAGDIHGHRKSDAACQAANLSAQLAARTADLEAARHAAADAAMRTAAIEANAEAEKKRTDAYVKQLEGRKVPACNLSDADLRGMQPVRRRSR